MPLPSWTELPDADIVVFPNTCDYEPFEDGYHELLADGTTLRYSLGADRGVPPQTPGCCCPSCMLCNGRRVLMASRDWAVVISGVENLEGDTWCTGCAAINGTYNAPYSSLNCTPGVATSCGGAFSTGAIDVCPADDTLGAVSGGRWCLVGVEDHYNDICQVRLAVTINLQGIGNSAQFESILLSDVTCDYVFEGGEAAHVDGFGFPCDWSGATVSVEAT